MRRTERRTMDVGILTLTTHGVRQKFTVRRIGLGRIAWRWVIFDLKGGMMAEGDDTLIGCSDARKL